MALEQRHEFKLSTLSFDLGLKIRIEHNGEEQRREDQIRGAMFRLLGCSSAIRECVSTA